MNSALFSLPSSSSAAMTLNGVRVPCPCSRCRGVPRDYRTVQKHKAKEAADQPLFPMAIDPPSGSKVDNEMADVPEEQKEIVEPEEQKEIVEPASEQLYSPPAVEDMVSHVEALPSCYEPLYETVLYLRIMHYPLPLHDYSTIRALLVHYLPVLYHYMINALLVSISALCLHHLCFSRTIPLRTTLISRRLLSGRSSSLCSTG
jgi:hypothetical protein